MRPLKRLVDSPLGERELDEEATAQRAAEDGLWLPECRTAQERWLDLEVVIDDGRFAELHRPVCDQLVDSVTAVGAFRIVRVHLLDTGAPDVAGLVLRSPDLTGPSRPATSLTETGPPGRRLVLVLTDGVGDAWHSSAAHRVLAHWGRTCPVGIVNVLPRRQWRRTGLATRPAWLMTPGAAVPNRRYEVSFPPNAVNFPPNASHPPSTRRAFPEPVEAAPAPIGTAFGVETARGAESLSALLDDALCVPVMEIDAGELEHWTGLVAETRHRWYGSVAICGVNGEVGPPLSAERDDEVGSGADPVSVPSAAELVSRFRATAEPTAFALAVHLAAAPLNIHTMRLIQREMLPHSRPADLCELIGSGLLRRRNGIDKRPSAQSFDEVTYDFVAGLRPELLAAGRRSETARVLTLLGAYFGERVKVLSDLADVVTAPDKTPPPTALTSDNLAFAEPAMHALRVLSGPYRRPFRTLEKAVERARQETSGNGKETIKESPQDSLGDIPRDESGSSQDMYDDTTVKSHEIHKSDPYDAASRSTSPGVGVTIRNTPHAPERSPSDPPPIWGNVPARNISFVGREEILADLHRRLSEGTTAVLPEALHGMGGVGKSQIAIEYVHRHTRDYDLIWWIPSERTGQVQQSFVELAMQLDLKVGQEVNSAVPAVREALRLGRPYRNWLLVFDNAEQLDEIRQFFPTNGPGKILVTSRNQAWTTFASSLEVDIFQREESMALLRARGPELNDEAADEIATVLGDLPLAIEQAAVWLSETGMPVEEYLSLFKEKHDRATELLGGVAPAAYELPVAAAWNVSLDRLRESNPAALQLLQVCAFFAPEPISRRLLSGGRNVEGPPDLLEALNDPIKLARAMRAINQYALAKISYSTGTITLHRLVQRVLVGQMSPQQAAEFRHCGHQLLTKFDPGSPDLASQWNQYAELLPHVLHSGIVDCEDQWARELVLNQIDFLFHWGDHQGFLDLSQRAVDTWTAKLGEDHEQTLSAGLRLGRALRLLGRFKEAYERHLRVRDIFLESRGPEDERTLEAQTLLGADLRYLGRFREALELDERSLEIVQRRFGPEEPMTLEQAHLYGIDLRLTGDPERAGELDHETYRNKANVFGEDHISTLYTLVSVAIDDMESGRYLTARDLMNQVEQRFRIRYGESHPGAIDNASILAVAERKAGAHERALELSTNAVAAFRRRYGQGHPGALAAALNHAINLRQAGDLDASIELATESGQQYAALFGPNHPNTASSRVNLAVALRLAGRIEEALEIDRTALEKLTEVLGAEHPRSLVCAINLATDLFVLGRLQEARDMDEATLERTQRVIGEDHPTALACSLNYSIDLRETGDEEAARLRFADTLARYRRVLGDIHPATVAAGRSTRADCDIYPIPV